MGFTKPIDRLSRCRGNVPYREHPSSIREEQRVTINLTKTTIRGAKKKTAAKITLPSTVSIKGKKLPVTSIMPGAFKGMKKLKVVVIGKNISTIGKNAFYGCTKLKSITIKTTKLMKGRIGSNAFKGIYKKAAIHCPQSKKTFYKKILLGKGIKKTMKFR